MAPISQSWDFSAGFASCLHGADLAKLGLFRRLRFLPIVLRREVDLVAPRVEHLTHAELLDPSLTIFVVLNKGNMRLCPLIEGLSRAHVPFN